MKPSLPELAYTDTAFHGAKVVVFQKGNILVKLRDNKPNIYFPNQWDFPGGGRESDESPIETAIRECGEEFSVTLQPGDIIWGKKFPAAILPNAFVWFFVAVVPDNRPLDVALGDEGQECRWMSRQAYEAHPKAIAHLIRQLADWGGNLD